MGSIPMVLFVASGIAAAGLSLILIADAVLWTREEDKIFIDEEDHPHVHERQEFFSRVKRLRRPVVALSWITGVLFFSALTVWLFQGIRTL